MNKFRQLKIPKFRMYKHSILKVGISCKTTDKEPAKSKVHNNN